MIRTLTFIISLLLNVTTPVQAEAQEYVKVSVLIQYPANVVPQPNRAEITLSTRPQTMGSVIAKAAAKVNERFELLAPKDQPIYMYLSTTFTSGNMSLTRINWHTENNSYRFAADKELVINLPTLIEIQGNLEDASEQPLSGKVSLGLGWFSEKKSITNDGMFWTVEGGQVSYTEVAQDGVFVLYGVQNSREVLRVEGGNLQWQSWYFSSLVNTYVRICLPVNFGSNRTLPKSCLLEASVGRSAFSAEMAAKQEAEAKASAEAGKKKTTITCKKGKLTKKVTAVNPKCPKGYVKK